MKQNPITFAIAFCLIVFLTNCQSRKNNQNMADENVIYPMDVIRDTLTADVHSQTTLYPLQEEVLESFLEKAQHFQGKKWTRNCR